MGIENIIKRLQDIDKLKFVIFDQKQRKAFEYLPKPGISLGINSQKSSTLTMESIVRSKKQKKDRETLQKFKFLLNGDPINKRMFELLDEKTKNNLFENQAKG